MVNPGEVLSIARMVNLARRLAFSGGEVRQTTRTRPAWRPPAMNVFAPLTTFT